LFIGIVFHTADSVAAGVAACRLISSNAGQSVPSFSHNVVRKSAMFLGQAIYVLGPLHLLTPLTNAEAIYKANLDMKGFHQEVVRVVLLDSQLRCITKVEISKGTVNASFACPREILRPAITHSSFGFALVHNHPRAP
jgi:DNA repair protein RadC